ncbi:uncharacterized protein LOC141628868 [Silene latifolia]|uniref:uncharacterized protein LOC141628868 n=1 Tax=Silene latifolia TaxID=37657 RepID=UPI003D780510
MVLNTKKKVYRLETWCFDHAECSGLVKESWERKDKGDASHILLAKLRRINNAFRVWACNKKDESGLKWSAFDQDLESYLLDIEKGGAIVNYEACHKKLMEFSLAAGTYWRQRTKLKWNCEGDTCTKYFFNWAKGRSGANLILGIKKESNEWTFDMKEIGGLFLKHCSTIFNSDSEPECFEDYLNKYGYLFDNLKRKVGMEEKAMLGRVYSKNEVRAAVFQLRPLKSPGPSYSGGFLPEDVNLIKGIKICKNWPEISHLLFADDSLFFIRGDFGDLDFIMNIIDEYCVASGQCLNKDKSSLLFSPNCSLMTVKKCLTKFKFAPKHDFGNYLSLPTSIGSSKRDLFKFIVDKTKRRLSSWNNILLSSAGLWEKGGLGLRNIGCCNQALLAKSAWRILCVPGSLISKVIGPKLGVQDDILFQNHWKAPQASSWALKSLSKWIEGYSLHDLYGDFFDAPIDSTLLVGDLHDNHRRWDLSSLGFDTGEGVTKKILATYIPCQPSDDSFYWKFSKLGVFTVNSGYYVAAMALSNGLNSNVDRFRMSAPIVTFCKSKLWKLPISNKLTVFLWKFMTNALLVGSEFLKQKMDWRSSCSFCDESSSCVESISQLFRDCSFAKAL